MTQTANAPISELRSSLHGELVEAGDATYDDARRVWTPPSTAARSPSPCAPTSRTSRRRCGSRLLIGVEVAVRCGAHSMSGSCVVDDGLVIDLAG